MKNKFFRSKLFSVGIILFLMLSISACSNKPGTIGEFIYTAGWYTDASGTIACYWKNGVKIDLPVLPTHDGVTVTSIYVIDSVVYVAGSYTNGLDSVAFSWKTGDSTWTYLFLPAHDSVTVTSIYVSGSNVYVAGWYTASGKTIACYWLNGTMTYHTDPSLIAYARAFGIYVSGSDVYVAGDYIDGGINYACYWKNGTVIPLPVTPAPDGVMTATSIYVSGSVVYVAGYYINVGVNYACYWQDATVTGGTVTETDLPLTTAPDSVTATSIYVSGSYVYVADSYINGGVNSAAMWTSNTVTVPVPVTELTVLTVPAGVTVTSTTSIYVIKSDIYVGGYYTNGSSTNVACYWKNGVRADLPAVIGENAEVESIFVATL